MTPTSDAIRHATDIIVFACRDKNRAKQIRLAITSGHYNSINEVIQKIETLVDPFTWSKQIAFAKQALENHSSL